MSHAGIAAHLDKSYEHAKEEIEGGVYHASLYQPSRRQAIFSAYSSLTKETKQKMDLIADRMVLNFRERLIGQENEGVPMLSHEGAIEIIITLFFSSDWYPVNSKAWKMLQEVPAGSVDVYQSNHVS